MASRLSGPAIGSGCRHEAGFPVRERAAEDFAETSAGSSPGWPPAARPSEKQTSKSHTTAERSVCGGSRADSADRGSWPAASTAGAARSDRLGAVLPPFLVALAFLPATSSIHFSCSRWWPSAEATDLRQPDACAMCARLVGGPASYVSALLSVAPDGWADSLLLPCRKDRKSATKGYT